jgi:hypothetical protein
MADTTGAPESRTLLLRRIAQLEDDLAETRGCIVRLASVIESLLTEGAQPAAGDADLPDEEDWVAPVIPLEPGRPRRDGTVTGQGGAGQPLSQSRGQRLRRLRPASSGRSSGTARR